MILLPRLYAIADATFGDPVKLAGLLFQGGARLLQVRNKRGSVRDLLGQVEAILRLAPPEARVLVNDRVDVALLSCAHGVHLGQDDLPIEHARSVLGNEAVIGFSTHNPDQARRADESPIDYIAVGPIFPTHTKESPDPVLGLEGLQEISRMVRKPIVAIGGITLERASAVFAAGATSVAVISDLLKAGDIVDRTKLWIDRSV